MRIEKIRIGNKEVMPFTIPSGIVMTSVATASKFLREIEELGIWTTKSIGPRPRVVPTGEILEDRASMSPNNFARKYGEIDFGYREPILYQYAPGCWGNAIGLTNPGAEEFAKELEQSRHRFKIPGDKFVLASIFGKNADEFVFVQDTLERLVDGFELNLSCPHCDKVGIALGQDPDIVKDILSVLRQRTSKPIFAKLTPNARNIGDIAKTAIAAGADGISAINTLGPELYVLPDGTPILTNQLGGMSGIGIKPAGLRCVRDIRKAIGDKPLINISGGIGTARDVEEYRAVGGENVVYAPGSALAGMDDTELRHYFSALHRDVDNGTNFASQYLKKVDMNYRRVRVEKVRENACDLRTIVTNTEIDARAGQFVFAFIPGESEKPFSVMDDSPLTLGVLERGKLTRALNKLKAGDSFYVRGPYGKGIDFFKIRYASLALVGGGCGIAGLYLLAKKFNNGNHSLALQIFLGAKDGAHLLHDNEFSRYGQMHVATEDGSLGRKGLVTDLLKREIEAGRIMPGTYFFNCGPEAMIREAVKIERTFAPAERIYSSVDYMTRCGVGICGSCADEKGRRTCIEGPFMNL